jgi:hypothetical protein
MKFIATLLDENKDILWQENIEAVDGENAVAQARNLYHESEDACGYTVESEDTAKLSREDILRMLSEAHQAAQGKGDQGAMDVWNVVAGILGDGFDKGGVEDLTD